MFDLKKRENKKIYIATSNKGKVEYIQTIFSKYGIKLAHRNIDLPEPRSDCLKTIAKSKVKNAYEKIKKPCIAIDSGFYIHSLNGFPKAFVALPLKTIGIKGILKLVKGLKRDCEFRDCLAFYDGKLKEPKYFESITRGTLLYKPRKKLRSSWGELHTIFLPNGSRKTFSEMTNEEWEAWKLKIQKNQFSTKFTKWYIQNK